MDYTPAQLEAISVINNNLQIIACAGSGKTRVVAARVVRILKERASKGITPENIIAFTFTEKAAAELKDRIVRYYKEEFGNVRGLAGMYVGTIHGFCLDILQRHLFRYLKYDILDEVRQRLLVDRNYNKSGMSSLNLTRWKDSPLYIAILSLLRNAEADPNILKDHPVHLSLLQYQNLLDQKSYLDYDEILIRAVAELIDNGRMRDQISDRVKYLTVDEYQDVNPIQEFLIRRLHELGANLCVVGDDDQNVYQWRGSDVTHIVRFSERYNNVVQVPLEINFRSSPAIVEVARKAVEVNSNRLPKAMQSGDLRDFQRGDLLALRFPDPDSEASWVAKEILSLRGLPYKDDGQGRGLSWSDFAILLRSVRNSGGPIVEALRSRGIPYIVAGMTGLFDTSEVQAASAIFQFMTHEIDENALKQTWRNANLALSEERLDQGVSVAKDRRLFKPGTSAYKLQRSYLDFLEAIGLCEDQIPEDRGEVVFYNLGKFSQVIADYEEIHFKSKPEEKYRSFVQFLRYQAPRYYPEGGQDVAYSVPDAVRIMTVHQAKGMEFPVVFLPCLQRNRFPARRQHNRVWNHLPREAIRNADRFDTSIEDERRLMYVALTRSEKYLFCSWAPDSSNRLYQRPSEFWEELTRREQFLTREPPDEEVERLKPTPRRPLVNIEISFSDLKYFFECPYQFKLRFLYGFNPPIDEALGYGRSLHNALAEVHRRTLAGELIDEGVLPELLDKHFHARYAYPQLEAHLRNSAEGAVRKYLQEQGPYLDRVEYAEEVVELNLPDGVVLNGRIDLIKRVDTGEVAVVDFKSTERAQAEDITRLQLHVYALGFEEKFGRRADLIEVYNLDAGGSVRELVDEEVMGKTKTMIREAGLKLRDNQFGRRPVGCTECQRCDMDGICRIQA